MEEWMPYLGTGLLLCTVLLLGLSLPFAYKERQLRSRVLGGDVFGAVADGVAFDCVVANLPYIRSGDLEPVPAGLRFEPRLALDGGGDGLDAYRTLLAAAPARLKPGGLMLLEAGGDTTVALAELAAFAFGARGCVHVHRDYAGCPRVVDIRT
ncbi:MAG: hypothetical protein NVS3B16_16080 [Vulcanimicrobiaceae bacterium]